MRLGLMVAVAASVIAAVTTLAGATAAWAGDDACAEASAAPFADREEISAVHRPAVDCLWHLGVVRGRTGSDGQPRFLPNAEITRAQFAGMAHQTLEVAGYGEDLGEPRRPRFDDVDDGHPFDDAVHTLAGAGIVRGVDAQSFAPGVSVRRDQTASLLVAAAKWATGRPLTAVDGPHFGDIGESVHRDAIEAGFEYRLVAGTRRPCGDDAGGRYSPSLPIEREQVATLLVRALDALDEINRGEGGGERGDADCPPPEWQPRLEAALEFAQDRSGAVSFAAIGTDGELVGHRANTQVAAASVIKVMFMVAYLREPDVRDRALRDSDRELLEPMIRRSANEPATRIADRLGPGPMNRLAETAGMRDFSYTRPWGNSRISARDQVAFMHDLHRYIPARHRDDALQLLTEIVSAQRWGIGEVSTPAWTKHFKGGWGSGTGSVNHQVAMLRHDHGTQVAVAVMTTNSPNHDYASNTLRGVFRRLLEDLPDH